VGDRAEVGVGDGAVGPDLVWRALGDDGAEVEDAVAQRRVRVRRVHGDRACREVEDPRAAVRDHEGQRQGGEHPTAAQPEQE
jgi:hypothetical protein